MKSNGKSDPTNASNAHRPNGESTLAASPSHSLDNVIDPAPGCGAILQMQTGLFELGRNRSQVSGTAKPVPEDILSLENHARSIARDTYRDQFDPKKNVHDREWLESREESNLPDSLEHRYGEERAAWQV